MTHPLDPQPAPGVEVVMCTNNKGYYFHAMEVGQGYTTQFWHCPFGAPDDVVCHDGVWVWIMPEEGK